jgi:hypothetical protein
MMAEMVLLFPAELQQTSTKFIPLLVKRII